MFSASLLKPIALLSEGEAPVLAVRICPRPLDSSLPRTSKHLALLLDTSGSMEGERLDTVKRTIHLLIDALPVGDSLSILQYDSTSSFVLRSSCLGTDRLAVHSAVSGLAASGGTNLENGILLLKELLQESAVDSVFLLTDGHINEGLHSGNALLRILGTRSQNERNNLPPLNTLGFGSDYNIKTLQTLSIATRGSHTFADAAERIPDIIGDIVGGLASEVGNNGTLQIPEGWRCLELGSTESAEGITSYKVGTLIAEKDQWVVLEGPLGIRPENIPASLTFTYYVSSVPQSHTIPIDDRITQEEVSEQICRSLVAATYGKVTDLMEKGKYEEAKVALHALNASLTSSLASRRPFVIRLLAQVDEMLEELQQPTFRLHAGVAPRMASNMVALGVQRGVVSRIHTDDPQESTYDDFRSPTQRSASANMTAHYSQQRSSSPHRRRN